MDVVFRKSVYRIVSVANFSGNDLLVCFFHASYFMLVPTNLNFIHKFLQYSVIVVEMQLPIHKIGLLWQLDVVTYTCNDNIALSTCLLMLMMKKSCHWWSCKHSDDFSLVFFPNSDNWEVYRYKKVKDSMITFAIIKVFCNIDNKKVSLLGIT